MEAVRSWAGTAAEAAAAGSRAEDCRRRRREVFIAASIHAARGGGEFVFGAFVDEAAVVVLVGVALLLRAVGPLAAGEVAGVEDEGEVGM